MVNDIHQTLELWAKLSLSFFQTKAVDDCVSRTRTAILSENKTLRKLWKRQKLVGVIGKET